MHPDFTVSMTENEGLTPRYQVPFEAQRVPGFVTRQVPARMRSAQITLASQG